MKLRLLILVALAAQQLAPTEAADSSHLPMVSQREILNAPVKIVWDALRKERTSDPEHRQVLSSVGGDYVIKEKFDHLPVVGDAMCTYKEHEVPMSKLEYEMVTSDKLKAFAGVWELTPQGKGSTLLQLSSRIDTGISMPFSRQITKDATMKSIVRRLSDIKVLVSAQKLAEVSSTEL
jgi:hypothetical protein